MDFRLKLERLKNLPTQQGFFLFFVGCLVFWLGINFVIIPIFNIGDAIIYSRATDWRIGNLVHDEIIRLNPEARGLTISLEPDDMRKGRSIASPGTAHLFAKKKNGQFDERIKCRYETEWLHGFWGMIQFRPSRIVVNACQASS